MPAKMQQSHGLSYLHSSMANAVALAIASCCGQYPGRICDKASHLLHTQVKTVVLRLVVWRLDQH